VTGSLPNVMTVAAPGRTVNLRLEPRPGMATQSTRRPVSSPRLAPYLNTLAVFSRLSSLGGLVAGLGQGRPAHTAAPDQQPGEREPST
jgi:hypothetical protein